MRAALALAALLTLTGCGRYDDFTLPVPASGPAATFRWEVRAGPVLKRGAPGEWDSVDALNPSVVHFNGALLNLYSGFDGKIWRTGAATSPDGLTWIRQGPVLSPEPSGWEAGYIAANGSAIVYNGALLYWYQAGSPVRIGLARSSTGIAFTRQPGPVLDTGPTGSWDERGVADAYVIRAAQHFYMFYLGMDRAHRQRIGIARSSEGITWTKLRSNPILELGSSGTFDEAGLGEPAVWSSNGYYWMLYTGRDRNELRRIGLARSRDGAHWQRSNAAPVFAGNEAWDDKVVCDPTVEPTSDGVRVWFGGGNAARPDERLNGMIGYAFLRSGGE
jgi:predicted GH43/DUF377 family glycosyl hydrolase